MLRSGATAYWSDERRSQACAAMLAASQIWPVFGDGKSHGISRQPCIRFAAGDYYAVSFEEDDSEDLDRPYLIIQRQFEDPEDDTCYIETHDPAYRGHFVLRTIELSPKALVVEFERPRDNLIKVTVSMTPAEFEEVSRVVKIISGEIEPESEWAPRRPA
jgi:hypothetical protein